MADCDSTPLSVEPPVSPPGSTCHKAAVRPKRTKHIKAHERLKTGVEEEIGQLHKTNALLIATQFAANHECEFDASDALAAIIVRVERHIETLDGLCLEAAP